MIRRKQLFNERTGEVLQDKSERFAEAMNDEGYRFPSHKAGARLFDDVRFPAAMKDAEVGKMTRLSKLMIGKTNMLGYRKGRNIEPYTGGEIAGLVGLQERQGKTFINKMLRLRVMQRVATASGPQYYINPAYFMASGHRLSLDLFLLFRDDLRPILPSWVMSEFLQQAKEKEPAPVTVEAERMLREERV